MNSISGISVVILVDRELLNIVETVELYKDNLKHFGDLEFVIVFDGNIPETLEIMKAYRRSEENIEILQFVRSVGVSAALSVGLKRSRGTVVLTLPAAPTIQPSELPRLVDALNDNGVDMVVARRSGPGMPTSPKLDRILQFLLDSPFRDIRSDVRAMRANVAAELTFYGTQHRFLPLIALADGFIVKEIDLKIIDGVVISHIFPDFSLLLDVLMVFFLLKFLRKPFRFFGGIGFAVLVCGALVTFWLVFARLFFGVGLADRPALILSTLMVVLGIQIIAVGLIGEIITFAYAREIKDYKVDRIIE